MTQIPINVFFEIVALIVAVGGVYVTLTNRITQLQTQMQERHREQANFMQKIDEIQKTLNDVLLKLENKANR